MVRAGGAETGAPERRWLYASPHDAFVWERIRHRSRELERLREEVVARIPAIEALQADLFAAFYRDDVHWHPIAPSDPAVAAHRHILGRVVAARAYTRLHEEVAGNGEDCAAVVAAFTRSLAVSLADEVASVLAADAAYANERASIEEEAAAIEAALEARARPKRRPPDADDGRPKRPEEMTAAEKRTRLRELEEAIGELEKRRRVDYRLLRARREIGHYLDAADLDRQVSDVAEALERFQAALATWGDDLAVIERVSLDERLALFHRLIRDERLRRATDLLGRARLRATAAHRSLTRAAPEAIAGLEMGDDLGRIVLSELVLLAEPTSVPEFLRRFAEHELLCYEVDCRASPERGPVIACLDESSSMDGERDIVAKAIALALAGIARADGRDASVIEFSGPGCIERTDLTAWATEVADVVEVVSRFLGGGTDFDGPLLAALAIVESDPRFAKADIVFVTDGEAPIHRDVAERLQAARERGGARLFAVCVGVDDRAFRGLADVTWPVADLLAERDDGGILAGLVESIH